MPINNAFEMLIKMFHSDETQFVKEASDFHASICVGVPSLLGRHQQPIRLVTVRMQVRRVVMTISQDEPDLGGHFAQQIWCRVTISDIGRSQLGSNGKPDRYDDGNDVPFPDVDPAVPARFGPVGFGINRGVRTLALFAVLLMPDAPASAGSYYQWYRPARLSARAGSAQ